ncbi:glycine betaine ABC transporter substrate-binding protein [Psychrobacter immobilis]|uniref:glycine betaine ABC transporter substrate-binding protein n=1 Tax=Psychrobacter immobilis TaxID=498 RepID=UPI002234E6BD|nr:glycine betaine ABC transporter substrate-binding protein [Psychrobacter immobilis]
MRQWIALSLLCISVLLLPVSASAACASPIKFGALTWESGQFTTGILKYIAESGYDCTIEEVPGAGPALETALSQNDIQIIGEQWVGRSPIMEQAINDDKVAVIGDTLQGGATQGWYVPQYVMDDNPGLRRYQDLPKYAALFKDPEDPSKSRFMNCPSGWACEIFNTRLLKNTGLDAVFNNAHPGTGAALDAEIASAFEQKKPLLFYYWQPTGLIAKYDFAPLAFPAHEDECWQDLLLADGTSDCVSGFPVSPLKIAASTPFIDNNPELASAFEKVQFTPDQLNSAILEMSESKRSGDEQALEFLRANPNVWQAWLPKEVAENLAANLGISLTDDGTGNSGVNPSLNDATSSNAFLALTSSFPSWSLESALNKALATVVRDYGDVFRSISSVTLTYLLLPIERLLTVIPAWLIIGLVTVLAWFGVRKVWFAIACGAGLFLIGAFGLWGALIDTLALLIVSVLVTVVVGIPIGIAMSGSSLLRKIITPILDVMQTMPSFVYLIPVLMLFGIGKVPALFATIIYALHRLFV